MRVEDFKVVTKGMPMEREIWVRWQDDTVGNIPIYRILMNSSDYIQLIGMSEQVPLTLEDIWQQTASKIILCKTNDVANIPIYGYRVENNRLILG